MSSKRKSLVFAAGALALVVTLLGGSRDAEARHRGRGGWFGFAAGAAIGAAVHGWFHRPPYYRYEYHAYPPAPPPPPVYGYPSYPYNPPPPPAPPPPPPVAVQPAYSYPRIEPTRIGLAVAGLVEAPQSGQLPLGGMAAAMQFRTSGHSLLSLEVQSLGAHRLSDDTRRSDLAGLVGGRVFLWNAAFAPYLELAGGLGQASLRTRELEVHAVQLLGRLGIGLELRLGRHLVLDAQVAQMHRLMFDEDGDTAEGHERATVFRGGVGLRF